VERVLEIRDLGLIGYGAALEIQEELVEARKRGEGADTLLLLEHTPVYTLGRNADEANVTATGAELEARGIEVVQTGRGGDVTYHGPGQLVGYPILDLGARGEGAVWYVGRLEQVMLKVLSEFGVEGRTDRKNRGVWVWDDKVGAIGVRITRHITMHGFSLNVCPDLSHYSGIVPCGIRDKGVTSLERLVEGVTMEMVKPVVVKKFVEILDYSNASASLPGFGTEQREQA